LHDCDITATDRSAARRARQGVDPTLASAASVSAQEWGAPPRLVLRCRAGGFTHDQLDLDFGGGANRHVLQPGLTTMHVPTEQMWRAVADRLIAALEHMPVRAATEVEVELVVRESTGPAPQH
jgi:hypothetical protein